MLSALSIQGASFKTLSPELHKCCLWLGAQGGLEARQGGAARLQEGEECLHSESEQMWGSRYTPVHGSRPGLATAGASAPSRQREATEGAGRAGHRQRPRNALPMAKGQCELVNI